MKLSVMREFVRLAAEKNYSRTAEELYIDQSALSRHMAALEEELNCRLINRSRNSFELTSSGEVALGEFQKILKDYENLLEQLARQTEIEEGELHVGVLYYDKDFYVSKIREVFHQKYPQIMLRLHSYQPAQLEKDLLDGKIDVAILYGASNCHRTDINYLPFLKIPYSLIYHKSHRFASMEEVKLSDLDGEKLLIPDIALEINQVDECLIKMLDSGNIHISQKYLIYNFDEVSWLMQETGAVYISPMVNNQAYGSETGYRFLQPETYHADVSAVWMNENKNPSVSLFCSVIKMCYP